MWIAPSAPAGSSLWRRPGWWASLTSLWAMFITDSRDLSCLREWADEAWRCLRHAGGEGREEMSETRGGRRCLRHAEGEGREEMSETCRG